MKKINFLLSLLLATSLLYAQSQQGVIEIHKKVHPAAILELQVASNTVNAALNNHLGIKGYRSNEIKGFTAYKNTLPLQGDSLNADLYFNIERKGKNDKESSVIALLVMPKVGMLATNNFHYMNMNNAIAYLNSLVPVIENYNLQQLINEQADVLKKTESKLRNLENEGADLEKKRISLEKKILENKSDQQTQLTEVENQKKKLLELSVRKK